MKENYYSQEVVSAPTAFVTKGRQRVKQFNDNVVYLKNGDEFEIELFNPTSKKVLAKIQLNGKTLGSGIILRPGERMFLERYFDEARKFLFETYEVDGNDPNAKKAIEENGKVEVEFYSEYIPYSYYHSRIDYQPYIWNPSIIWVYHTHSGGYSSPVPTSPIYTTTLGNVGNMSVGGQNLSYTSGVNTTSFSCSTDNNNVKSSDAQLNMSFASTPNPVETGRVEKGSTSNQRFTYDNTEFNNWYTWKVSWKILPESQKAFAKEELKVFCPNCRAKRKKNSHKFCPNCGSKF